ncbi:MAG: hypothetical protein QME81_07455 [bacterium]|nr:hypothetical protein [bacterium]
MRLCVSYFPGDYPSWLGSGFLRPAFNLLTKAGNYKRNPRNESYMKDLVAEVFGDDFRQIEAKDLRPEDIKKAEEIVLLWPDGNGYGWFRVESQIFAFKKRGAKVMVLNGRRRGFQLTIRLWFGYWLRRFLERFWIGELVFSAVFLVVSPLMVAWDLMRGRK